MAAIGEGMHPGVLIFEKSFSNFVVDSNSAQREIARGDGFGKLNDIWFDVPVVQGE